MIKWQLEYQVAGREPREALQSTEQVAEIMSRFQDVFLFTKPHPFASRHWVGAQNR